MSLDHVPCCLLSVGCGICGVPVGEPCTGACSDMAVCTCDLLPTPCCGQHHAEVAA